MGILELFQHRDVPCALLALVADQHLTCHPNWRSVDACTANIEALSGFRIGYQTVYRLATCSLALRDSISAVFPEGFVFFLHMHHSEFVLLCFAGLVLKRNAGSLQPIQLKIGNGFKSGVASVTNLPPCRYW